MAERSSGRVSAEPADTSSAEPADTSSAEPADTSSAERSDSSSAKQSGSSKFDRDTAVWREDTAGSADGQASFGAEIASDWRAGRGPHGGYLAALLLRALIASVADPERVPRSLTIHYARAPDHGPVQILTTLERRGRSLSTLSARMLQGTKTIALVLGAFSLPWGGPEICDVRMPDVEPADPSRESVKLVKRGGPEFARHLVLQPRMQGRLFAGGEQPMAVRAWIGLVEPRPIDALSLAFFSDALIPAPYMRLGEPVAVPTIDLTVHFRDHMRRGPNADPLELCLAQTTSELIHDGFFVEDGLIWAADGTLLAHSRQLAIVIPFSKR